MTLATSARVKPAGIAAAAVSRRRFAGVAGSQRTHPGESRLAVACQARSRPSRTSIMERNSGAVKVVKPAYTLLIFW